MNKTAILAVCILFLFGGLIGLRLAAQPSGTGSRATENVPSFSLLDPNISERSEKELLERKIVARQRIVADVVGHSQAGSPRGSAMRLAEAHADLAAAEIELYRYTGEQDKLLVALKARVEYLTNKLRAATSSREGGTMTSDMFHEVELQLLDALLEQKRVHASEISRSAR